MPGSDLRQSPACALPSASDVEWFSAQHPHRPGDQTAPGSLMVFRVLGHGLRVDPASQQITCGRYPPQRVPSAEKA